MEIVSEILTALCFGGSVGLLGTSLNLFLVKILQRHCKGSRLASKYECAELDEITNIFAVLITKSACVVSTYSSCSWVAGSST